MRGGAPHPAAAPVAPHARSAGAATSASVRRPTGWARRRVTGPVQCLQGLPKGLLHPGAAQDEEGAEGEKGEEEEGEKGEVRGGRAAVNAL